MKRGNHVYSVRQGPIPNVYIKGTCNPSILTVIGEQENHLEALRPVNLDHMVGWQKQERPHLFWRSLENCPLTSVPILSPTTKYIFNLKLINT